MEGWTRRASKFVWVESSWQNILAPITRLVACVGVPIRSDPDWNACACLRFFIWDSAKCVPHSCYTVTYWLVGFTHLIPNFRFSHII